VARIRLAVEWGFVLRQNPEAKRLAFVGRVTVVLSAAASPVTNTAASLDAPRGGPIRY
jgi:hypothetical protein